MRYLFVSILLVLAAVPAAQAKVYINIDSPSAQKFPIAITTFRNMSQAASQESLSPWFADTLGKTLEITGFFSILDRKAFLVDQAKLGILLGSGAAGMAGIVFLRATSPAKAISAGAEEPGKIAADGA